MKEREYISEITNEVLLEKNIYIYIYKERLTYCSTYNKKNGRESEGEGRQ